MEDKKDEHLKRIISAREKSFEESRNAHEYIVERNILGYEKALPPFESKSLREIISGLARPDGQEEPHDISVLDVGCGMGAFLADLKDINPEIDACGISGRDFRLGEVMYASTGKGISSDAIDYRIGDIQKVQKIFSDKKFDLITSVYTFAYLGDPLNAIRQCYSLLKPNGLLLIDDPGINLTPDEINKLMRLWEGQGIKSELVARGNSVMYGFTLAVKKSADGKLPMPFSYTNDKSRPKLNL